jgi:hypothetical protein
MSRLGTRLKAVGRYIDLPAKLLDFISPVNTFSFWKENYVWHFTAPYNAGTS